jgi:hypothetical protein
VRSSVPSCADRLGLQIVDQLRRLLEREILDVLDAEGFQLRYKIQPLATGDGLDCADL